ncbi:MAG: dicarboxylate/amino acid:cation symporter [Chitinophagales bacterium]
MIITKPLNELTVHIRHLVKNRLWLKVIIGLILGALAGLAINPSTGWVSKELSQTLGSWLNLPGDIFMKLVQMVMIPLIFASIISGLVSNVSEDLKSFGLKLFLYFIFTTVVAIIFGIILAYQFKPGEFIRSQGGFSGQELAVQSGENPEALVLNIPKAISNLVPANPLESILSGEMLSIVIFTVIIGIALTQIEQESARPVVRFIESIQKISMIIVGWAMRLVPYAVFGLMAALISTTGVEIFLGLGYYMMVIMLGLLLILIFYMLIYFLVVRKNPFSFIANIKDALLLAFSTASSAAVMPLSMKIADEKLGVSSKVSDFVIPIGAIINMNGTAMFQCVTVLFMAQAYGIELGIMNVVLLTVTVVSASIGTPAIPGGGVIILASVLKSTGIPTEGLLVIIGIDRILGMFRTAVNVSGDLTACVVFNRWYGDD